MIINLQNHKRVSLNNVFMSRHHYEEIAFTDDLWVQLSEAQFADVSTFSLHIGLTFFYLESNSNKHKICF